MFYRIVRFFTRIAHRIFFRYRHLSHPEVTELKGPLIFASNHPDSFLDSVVLLQDMKQPVHTIVRGDVFKGSLILKIFAGLKMIPIHRLSEGREHLSKNDETFELCREVLKNGGILIIFSEGNSINEWNLRPLKKGTARIVIPGWEDPEIGDRLRVMPMGLNYSAYQCIGKGLDIQFGNMISKSDFENPEMSGRFINEFNKRLSEELKPLVWDEATVKSKVVKHLGPFLQILYALPALAGWLLNAPFYYPMKKLAWKLNKGGVFYDSILFCLCLFTYPVYAMIITILCVCIIHLYSWALLILMPLLGWFTVQFFSKR